MIEIPGFAPGGCPEVCRWMPEEAPSRGEALTTVPTNVPVSWLRTPEEVL